MKILKCCKSSCISSFGFKSKININSTSSWPHWNNNFDNITSKKWFNSLPKLSHFSLFAADSQFSKALPLVIEMINLSGKNGLFFFRHFFHPVGCFSSYWRNHKFTRIFSQSQTSSRKKGKKKAGMLIYSKWNNIGYRFTCNSSVCCWRE